MPSLHKPLYPILQSFVILIVLTRCLFEWHTDIPHSLCRMLLDMLHATCRRRLYCLLQVLIQPHLILWDSALDTYYNGKQPHRTYLHLSARPCPWNDAKPLALTVARLFAVEHGDTARQVLVATTKALDPFTARLAAQHSNRQYFIARNFLATVRPVCSTHFAPHKVTTVAQSLHTSPVVLVLYCWKMISK